MSGSFRRRRGELLEIAEEAIVGEAEVVVHFATGLFGVAIHEGFIDRDVGAVDLIVSVQRLRDVVEMGTKLLQKVVLHRGQDRVAGKTGTTQSYRDAWFCGFTGNYTAAIWMGNDDFHPTRNMTGGSLPAMTWERLMEYAHKNIDLKPIPGLEHPFVDEEAAAKAADAEKREAEEKAAQAIAERPAVLSSATTQFLKELAKRFRSAPPIEPPAEPKTLSAL